MIAENAYLKPMITLILFLASRFRKLFFPWRN